MLKYVFGMIMSCDFTSWYVFMAFKFGLFWLKMLTGLPVSFERDIMTIIMV